MPWRMLEYISLPAGTYRLELLSVVFYVGRGAGVDDTGHHQVQSPTGSVTPCGSTRSTPVADAR
jgi:hypothetical protein